MRPHQSYSSFAVITLVGLVLLVGVPVMQAMMTAPHLAVSNQRSAFSAATKQPHGQPAIPVSKTSVSSTQPTAEPVAIFIPTATIAPTLVPVATIAPAATATAFGCRPNTWALPVRDTTYKVVGTFGTKSNDSHYVQGLKAVGGVAQTANGVFHPGVDLRARMYAPVYAVSDGIVEEVTYNGQYGKHVLMMLAHADTTEVVTETLYGHLSDIFVKAGQHVVCGQVIAISGNTGVATLGPHLHFEVRNNGKPVNPQRMLDALYAMQPPTTTGVKSK